MLYGLHWDNSEQREYFVSINPVSGIHTLIDSLPGVHAIATGLTTYDDNNHYYIFHGVDNSGNQHIYTVDVSNGSIVAQPIITSADNLGIMQYDTESNDLYALKWDASTQTEYIVQLDQYTGSYSVVCNVPGVQSIVLFPSYATYNSNDHQFIFRGGISGDWRLFSVDVQSGQVISNPVFPVLSDPNDNLIELQYDNTSAVLYGLHWDNYSSTAGIDQKIAVHEVQIFPNPFSEQCTLELGQSYGEISVFLYDESGRLVSEENVVNASSVTLLRGNLCPGTYHTVIIGDHILLGNSKLSVF